MKKVLHNVLPNSDLIIIEGAETELRDSIYEPANHSDFYKYCKNKYDMPDDTTCRIRVSYSSYIIYDATIQMKSDEKSVKIRSTIFKNSEAKKDKSSSQITFHTKI